MKYKTLSFCYLLFVIGVVTVFFSLASFPIRKTEADVISTSRFYYDHHQSNISSNSSEYKAVKGTGYESIIHEGSILNISLRVQPGNVNVDIEGRRVEIKYTRIKGHIIGVSDLDFYYYPTIEFMSDWLTRESYDNTSSLDVNHTISEGDWLYRLRFQNVDTQTNQTVDLSVIEYWTEVDLREEITSCYLLPSECTYIGVIVLAIGAVVSIWGITTKKFACADARNFIQGVFHEIRNYMDMKKIIVVFMLGLTLLFLSIFVHIRLGTGEILVDQEMMETFVTYRGFPLEMIGTVTPASPGEWDDMFENFGEIAVYARARAIFLHQYYDVMVYSSEPLVGSLVILQDGLFWNSVLYFTLSFFLVLTLSYLKKN